MTPYGFARMECANMRSDGSCLGIQPEDLVNCGQEKLVYPLTKCLLAEKPIKPCKYFERCVLPIADWPPPDDKPQLGQERIEARDQYLAARKMEVPEVSGRACPDCGAILGKNKRLCPKCSRNRRLESYRKKRDRLRHRS
jgi:hypothetical protein